MSNICCCLAGDAAGGAYREGEREEASASEKDGKDESAAAQGGASQCDAARDGQLRGRRAGALALFDLFRFIYASPVLLSGVCVPDLQRKLSAFLTAKCAGRIAADKQMLSTIQARFDMYQHAGASEQRQARGLHQACHGHPQRCALYYQVLDYL